LENKGTPNERQWSKISCRLPYDSFARFFTWDSNLNDSAYHIEISRGSETFLFPCNNKREQLQIVEQIKEFFSQ